MADESSGKDSVIAPGTRIAGGVRGHEDLIVQGRIDGHIELSHTLTIDVGGVVQAQISVKRLIVNGALVGNARASDSIWVGEHARVDGDLSAPRISIAAGAVYRGNLEMTEGESRRAGRRQTDRPSSVAAASIKTPPRLAPPARAAAASPVSPPALRVVAASPPRPGAPPSLRRPDAVGGALAPGWAKKKLRRR